MVNQFIGAFKSIGTSYRYKISPGVLVDALMVFQVGFFTTVVLVPNWIMYSIYKSVARGGLTLSKDFYCGSFYLS